MSYHLRRLRFFALVFFAACGMGWLAGVSGLLVGAPPLLVLLVSALLGVVAVWLVVGER